MRKNQTALLVRLLLLCLIGVGIIVGIRHYSPAKVSHIRIKFMSRPQGFSMDAMAYLLYELNRLQEIWYFDVDQQIFNRGAMTSAQAAQCADEDRQELCFAEIEAGGQPMIGITTRPLGDAYFSRHLNHVSVISTADKSYEPLSTYDF